jgi:hypothetical protein
MSKTQELEVIRSGDSVQERGNSEVSVRFIGATAILLNRIRLVVVD